MPGCDSDDVDAGQPYRFEAIFHGARSAYADQLVGVALPDPRPPTVRAVLRPPA